jgi:hypothetical protein
MVSMVLDNSTLEYLTPKCGWTLLFFPPKLHVYCIMHACHEAEGERNSKREVAKQKEVMK